MVIWVHCPLLALDVARGTGISELSLTITTRGNGVDGVLVILSSATHVTRPFNTLITTGTIYKVVRNINVCIIVA
jgi:hypothetical protein